tara:strand:+ start:409 stop:1122 length:714 start_codon:yes stop_codon:yes gene_type:complete
MSELINISERSDVSVLTLDNYKNLCKGKYKTKYCGVPMQKDPYTMEILRTLCDDKKFGTIIEFGSLYGSSAGWFSSICENAQIYSFDIKPENVNDIFKNNEKIKFLYFNANDIDSFPFENIIESPKPWLIVEDCHVNVLGILKMIYPSLSNGDYIVIEDTNPLGPSTAMVSEDMEYIPYGTEKLEIAKEFGKNHFIYVDTKYCDRFGLNSSNQWNSIFAFHRPITSYEYCESYDNII